MKELLQSKSFKKRFGKWVMMYTLVMGLFAMVVTYSRYVSSHMTTTSARAAKFNVEIKQEISCQAMSQITPKGVACFDENYDSTQEGLRAKPQIGFYFTVDTNDLEVSSKVVVTTTIKKNEKNYFTNYKLYDVTELIETQQMLSITQESLPLVKNEDENEVILEYMKNQFVSERGKRTYLFLLDYDYTKYKFNQLNLDKGEISVGYSATQID